MRQSVGAAVIGGGYFMWVDEEDLSEKIALIQVLNKIAKRHQRGCNAEVKHAGLVRNLSSLLNAIWDHRLV